MDAFLAAYRTCQSIQEVVALPRTLAMHHHAYLPSSLASLGLPGRVDGSAVSAAGAGAPHVQGRPPAARSRRLGQLIQSSSCSLTAARSVDPNSPCAGAQDRCMWLCVVRIPSCVAQPVLVSCVLGRSLRVRANLQHASGVLHLAKSPSLFALRCRKRQRTRGCRHLGSSWSGNERCYRYSCVCVCVCVR